ncbi:hypothetical protein [Haloechinothrix aidingensis]|nr:hypothetical protein [Haloechinothrix aidingensis]
MDGLFLQSNFGVVTRMGIWLMRRPDIIESFFFMYPNDDDIGDITDIGRELRLDGVVPTAIKATSDLYALSSQIPYPAGVSTGPIPQEVRRELHREHDLGAWVVSGAIYGSNTNHVRSTLQHVKNRLQIRSDVKYVPHGEAAERPELKIHIDTYSGRPTGEEVAMTNWRGGGIVSLTPATPMIGDVAKSHARMSRAILTEHGIDTCIDYIFAGRVARGLHSILFDPTNGAECERVASAAQQLRAAYRDVGYPVGRVPVDGQEDEMSHRDRVFRDVASNVKAVFDPGGVLSPGRYGIDVPTSMD